MTTIHRLPDPQFLRPIWERIFVSDNPFGWPFVSSINSGIVFYPTYGYHLEKEQYEAMIETARELGEQGFVVSIIEGEGDIMRRGEHWWCEYPSYEDYRNLPLVLENAIYSRVSTWGVMISHEDHAVVGGKEKFVETIRRKYPEWRTDLQRLMNEWEDRPNRTWVEELPSTVRPRSS